MARTRSVEIGANSVSSATMARAAGKKQAPMHRFSVRSRLILIIVVAHFMKDSDFDRFVHGVDPPEKFKLGSGQRNDTTQKATIGRAIDYIYNDAGLMKDLGVPMCLTKEQQRQCIENGLRSWMAECADRTRSSLEDRPRKARGGLKVSAEDLFWLGDLLVSVEYVDDDGNRRRFGSLDHILQHYQHMVVDASQTFAQREEAAERVRRMQSIMLRMQGKTLDALISRAAAARG